MALFVLGLLFCAFVVIVALCVLLRELKQDIEEIEYDHRRLIEDLENEADALRKDNARLAAKFIGGAEKAAQPRPYIFPKLFN